MEGDNAGNADNESSSFKKGSQIYIVEYLIEIRAHLYLKPTIIRRDLNRHLQLLHLPVVLIIGVRVPILLILQKQVKEVTVLVKGIVVLMVVHSLRQLQEVFYQIGYPTLVLLFRR
jgi:hypothetical protein